VSGDVHIAFGLTISLTLTHMIEMSRTMKRVMITGGKNNPNPNPNQKSGVKLNPSPSPSPSPNSHNPNPDNPNLKVMLISSDDDDVCLKLAEGAFFESLVYNLGRVNLTLILTLTLTSL
jgi:hypothetical protein